MTDQNCADCGGFDIEWMHHCNKHAGVYYCRGCDCPVCEGEWEEDCDYLYDEDEERDR